MKGVGGQCQEGKSLWNKLVEHGRTQTFPLRFDLQSVGRVLVVEAG